MTKSTHQLFDVPCYLASAKTKAIKKNGLHVFVTKTKAELPALLKKHGLESIAKQIDLKDSPEKFDIRLSEGHFFFLSLDKPTGSTHKELSSNDYSEARDKVGSLFVEIKKLKPSSFHLHFSKLNEDTLLGSLIGLEMAAYSFQEKNQLTADCYATADGKAVAKKILTEAQVTGKAVNISRHLVNLPPNVLYPQSFCDSTKSLFKGSGLQIEVWDDKRVEKEGLSLLTAVGQGSQYLPRLLKLSYRPKGKSKKAKYVFVGKGITFDTGGLDLKPSRFMRLMKKDMGGSASVMGLAYFVSQMKTKDSIDFYIALAENSVGSRAFRPGDIYTSRKGHTVEIDNTDAEGRLALADAITVALDESQPEILIDLATLTGAGKVALGTEIASLFANDTGLCNKLMSASQATGDWAWNLPLYDKYNSLFPSQCADFQNSAASGYGGAITAALFLKKFVDCEKDTPKWAHFDIYGWKDGCDGPFDAAGGNGQSVQALAKFLS